MSRCRKRSFWPAATRICSGDEIDAGRELGDRMLDLDARVHLDEEELVVLEQEFERSRAAVSDLAAGIGAALAYPRQRARRESRRRRFLDDLLMAALHRAVALEQPDRVLVLVGQHLDFDVPRVAEELLHVHRRIAEGRLRLGRA